MKSTIIQSLLSATFFLFFHNANSQQIVDIRFNLYADSVKTTIDNYINVEGKLSNGRYIPLTEKEISFSSDYGRWKGNCLLIDKKDNLNAIKITASLKSNPEIQKSTTVYVQKYDDPGYYLTEQDYMNQLRKRQQRSRRL